MDKVVSQLHERSDCLTPSPRTPDSAAEPNPPLSCHHLQLQSAPSSSQSIALVPQPAFSRMSGPPENKLHSSHTPSSRSRSAFPSGVAQHTQTTPIDLQNRGPAWGPKAVSQLDVSQLDTVQTPQFRPSYDRIGVHCPNSHNQIHPNRCIQPQQRQQQQQCSSMTLELQHLLSTEIHRAKHVLRTSII